MNLFQNHSGKPLPGTFASITGAPLLVPPSPSRPHREHPSQPVRRAAGDGGNGGGGEPGRCGEALAQLKGRGPSQGGREGGRTLHFPTGKWFKEIHVCGEAPQSQKMSTV